MIKILLVDDDVLMLNKMNNLLINFSDVCMVVDQVMDGKSAVFSAKKNIPDLVFMDVELPVISGIEATKLIKQDNCSIIVVALSNYDDFPYLRGMMQSGAVDYILKHELNQEIMWEKISTVSSQLKLRNQEKVDEYIISLPAKQIYLKELLLDQIPYDIETARMYQSEILTSDIYGFILFQITSFAVYYNKHNKQKLIKNVEIIVNNITNTNDLLITSIDHGEYAVLIRMKAVPSTKELQNKLNEYVALIRSNLWKMMGIKIIDSSSMIFEKFPKLHKYYVKAEGQLGSITIGSELDINYNMIFIQILSDLIHMEKHNFMKSLNSFFTEIENKQDNLSVLHKNMASLLEMIINYLKSKNDYYQVLQMFLENIQELNKSVSLNSCKEIAYELFERLFENIMKLQNKKHSSYIASALQYISLYYKVSA